ncbi:MAG: PAS domain S-box protein [Hyphomicrobiales bacterium]|nr:PAS domain S-box protein [Hyphomicrobiales bacterium]
MTTANEDMFGAVAGARASAARRWARSALTRVVEQRARSPVLFGVLVGMYGAMLALIVQFAFFGTAYKYPYLLSCSAVSLGALVAGVEGGLVATVASVLLILLFFDPPREPADLVALGIFVITSFLVSVAAEAFHRARARALRFEAADALQNRLSRIVETSLEAIYSVSPEGVVLTWNDGAEKLYGYSAAEIIGHSVAKLASRGARADLVQLSEFARAGRPVSNFDTQRVHKNGTPLLVELTASPIVSPSGVRVGMSVIARDVAERRRAADELRNALLQIQAKFENAAVGMADVASDGKWLRVNQKLCAIVGYSSEELSHMTFADITHPDDLEADLAQLRDLLAERITSYSMEKRYIRKDGAVVWVNLTVSRVNKPDGAFNHLLSIVEDITERKNAESHVRLLMAEVNHRANNLLAVVQSVAQQTASVCDPKTYAANLRERIQSLAASQRLLVETEWRGADIQALVEAQLAMFKDLIGTRIFISGPRATLTAGASQGVGMALHELVTNAAKYGALSNDKGRVLISWSLGPDKFTMSWREEGGPAVAPPSRRGFGRLVLGRMAESAVGGRSSLEFNEAGVAWTLTSDGHSMLERAL